MITGIVGTGVTGTHWYVALIAPARDIVTKIVCGMGDTVIIFGVGVGRAARNFCSNVLPKLNDVVIPPPNIPASPNKETIATIGVIFILKVVENNVCL